MSERTTIGGTVYEAIGSSSSNLLLKCNGTARIQWGGKLIDLIKNGKIASDNSQELIFIVQDESEIKSDGVYVLTAEETNHLLIQKDGNKYDLTGKDLYISASKPQNLTVEQKRQALDNIGMYYNTLEEVQKAGIKNGIVYIIDTKKLYTIKEGIIEEFEATLKTVTVEKENENSDVINGSVKIVLSVLDDEYLILADQRITANYSVHVKDSAQLGSENADKTQGYRLYVDGGTSYLDVDEINVRHGVKVDQYKELSFDDFRFLLKQESLEPHAWYLINDFQNPWKLVVHDEKFNRPILVRALTNKTLYEKGYLFKDHRITIKYDPFYEESILQKQTIDGVLQEVIIRARGRITWMKDFNNNEANFDFLDYTDHEGNELSTLHYPTDDKTQDKSIFPKYSYNNKILFHNLKGTVIKDGKIDDTNTVSIDFGFDDSETNTMKMYNNDIECVGIILHPECLDFCNNSIKKVIKLEVGEYFCNNTFEILYGHVNFENIDINNFNNLEDVNVFSSVQFFNRTDKVNCIEARHCIFQNEILNSNFTNIENCAFREKLDLATIEEVKRPNSTYIYTFNKITNSTIKLIEKECMFLSEIKNSFIGTISESSIDTTLFENCQIQDIIKSSIYGSLQNTNINSIIESSLQAQLQDSTFRNINKSYIINTIIECFIKDINDSVLNSNLNTTTIENIESSDISGTINNSQFKNLNKAFIYGEIIKSSFENITNNATLHTLISNSTFKNIDNSRIIEITNCDFQNIYGSILNASFNNSKFNDLSGCNFDYGLLEQVVSFYHLSGSFNSVEHTLLYNSDKRKEIYITYKGVQIISIPDVIFYRGMIIMHSGIEDIPKGWAICDGGTYEFEGVISQTPNLVDRFIKATGDVSKIGEIKNDQLNDDNELLLKKEQLPKHTHDIATSQFPQYTTSDIEGYTSRYDPRSQFVTTTSGSLSVYVSVSVSVSAGEDSDSDSDSSSDSITLDGTTINYLGTDARYETVAHYHSIDWGSDYFVTENNNKNEEQKPIKLEPHYYSLIFIMKL